LTPPTQRGFSSRLIGDVAVALGYVAPAQVEAAVAEARATSRPTGRVLLERGAVTVDQLSRVVAERFGLDHVDLARFEVDPRATALVDVGVLRRYAAVPIAWTSPSTLLVAMAEPSNVLAIDDISMLTGLAVTPAISAREDIDALLDALAGGSGPAAHPPDAAEHVQQLVTLAVQRGAAALHLTPEGDALRVRARVDGVLTPLDTVGGEHGTALLARLKVMAELDPTDHRRPQQGRTSVTVDGRAIDVRVATVPYVDGEAAVLRLLDRPEHVVGLDDLGLPPDEARVVARAQALSHGLLLVAGPGDAGQTATLHALLRAHAGAGRSVCTIEDPVERRIPGVQHLAVDPAADVDVASGLESLLAADPDVLLVGAVADPATAELTVQAALGGHLVLGGVRTADAPSAVAHLTAMGVAPYLVAGALRCVIAQRLVRRLCPECRAPVRLEPAALRAAGLSEASGPLEAFEAAGCGRCSDGYRGRVAVCEVLEVTDELRELILSGARAGRLAEAAERTGMRRLHDAALDRVAEGATSLAEITRVLAGRA
jgi:type IV pilus assembly protein PilB